MLRKLFVRFGLTLLLCLIFPVKISPQHKRASRSNSFAFTHVTVIDATGTPPQPDQTVLITGNRIAALGPTRQVHVPQGARVINASGKFLIPGLADMHVHLTDMQEVAVPLLIANGVTSVRDMGGDLAVIDRFKDAIEKGELLGPRIVRAGPFVDGPKPDLHYRLVVTNEREARAAAHTLKRMGVDFIKTHSGISREAFFAVTDEAKKVGLPVAVHPSANLTIAEITDAGAKSIEHAQSFFDVVVLNPANKDKNKRQLIEARYFGAGGQQLYARFIRNGTWIVPTLIVFDTVARAYEKDETREARLKYITPGIKQMWATLFPTQPASEQFIQALKHNFEVYTLRVVGEMNRAGVGLMAGSDTGVRNIFPGFSLHDELALLVRAGLTPMQALQTATSNPAKFLNGQDELGTIALGKLADLVLLDANPLADIHNTTKVNAVVVNGRLLERVRLDRMLAEAQAKANKQTSAL